MENVAIKIVLKGVAEITYNIKKKRKTNKDMDYNNSSRRFRPLGSRVMAFFIKCDSSRYGLSHVKNEFSLVGLTACQCENGQSERESVQKQ